MEKKSILFIINQLSGTVSSYNIPKCIEMFLDHNVYRYKTFYIEDNMSLDEYDKLFGQAWDVIVSVGGDGTLLDIGQRIVDTSVTLGIIPIGSGNGLATHLGYKPRDVEAAFRAINTLQVMHIDVAKINEHYFFSNFGCGIDALVAKDFKIKKKRSLFVYTFLTLKRIIKIQSKTIQYKLEDQTHRVDCYLFNIFNSNLFGYGVGLIPWASATDGLLDLVYLRKTNPISLLWATICILVKKPQWSSSIVYHACTEVTIINNEKLSYQVDGDPKSTIQDIQIAVLPSKLALIAAL